jgi:hypothetical protein
MGLLPTGVRDLLRHDLTENAEEMSLCLTR